MAKPLVYGAYMSPPVRAVLITAKAIKLDVDFKEMNMFELRTKEFLKINPQHTVPTIIDEGKIFWDSHAIATYLIGKYAKDDSLYPKDLYKRALIDQRLHFDSGILYPRGRSMGLDVILYSRHIPEWKIKSTYEAFKLLEKFLEKDLYMVGNTVTVADICCAATTSQISEISSFNSDKFPKTVSWLKRMSELPYFNEINEKGIQDYKSLFKTKLDLLHKL